MHKILLSTLIFFATVSIKLQAQVNHTVNTQGNLYSPSTITIAVGDTVTFVNTGGTHNVNGKTSTFATNVESFDNGSPSTGWTFKHVFTIAGTNEYQCDVHAPGMKGKVIVQAAMNLKTIDAKELAVYPNPTSGLVYLPTNNSANQNVTVYNALGQLVLEQNIQQSKNGVVNLSNLTEGIYTIGVAIENKATIFTRISVVK